MSEPILLPNCLTSTRKVDHALSRSGNIWLYLYCANCGKDGGRVLETDLNDQFAFYLCQPCADTHGQIEGTYAVPDEVFYRKVADAQMECYGRLLSEQEVAIELSNDSSILSKLKKESR